MTTIVAMSDTHCQLHKVNVPEGDILIHAGDLTYRGTATEIEFELDKMAELPHEHKVIIAGNHDWLFEKTEGKKLARQMCADRNITYLEDSMTNPELIKIYGSPYQPEFFDWAFNLPRGAPLKEKWSHIPEGLDILVTHGPPNLMLDMTPRNEHVGCDDLMNRIQEVKPKIHIFGHIHHAYGHRSFNDTLYINASICDERYHPGNKPWIIEIEDDGKIKDIKNDSHS